MTDPIQKEIDTYRHELLSSVQGMTDDKLDQLIQTKKDRVGGNYLTTQGALWLIMGDHDLSLKRNAVSELSSIGNLQDGSKGVTVTGRVIGYGPVKTITTKKGEAKQLRNIQVWDGTGLIKVTCWEPIADMEIFSDLLVGDIIRITGMTVKQAPDGSLSGNAGQYSAVSLPENDPEEQLDVPELEAVDVSEWVAGWSPGVSGEITIQPSIMSFKYRNGGDGQALRLSIKDSQEVEYGVILWGGDYKNITGGQPGVGAKVSIYGVTVGRDRDDNPQILGSESCSVIVDGSSAVPTIEMIILSSRDTEDILMTGRSSDGKLWTIEGSPSIEKPSDLSSDSRVQVWPKLVMGNTIIADKIIPGESTAPIDLSPIPISTCGDHQTPCHIKGIVVDPPQTIDIDTKSGGTAKLTTTRVNDPTGVVLVQEWGEPRVLDDLQPADMVSIFGLSSKVYQNELQLQVTKFSTIELNHRQKVLGDGKQ